MFILLIYFKLRIILNNVDVSFKFLGLLKQFPTFLCLVHELHPCSRPAGGRSPPTSPPAPHPHQSRRHQGRSSLGTPGPLLYFQFPPLYSLNEGGMRMQPEGVAGWRAGREEGLDSVMVQPQEP